MGADYAERAINAGLHVVMVNVEAHCMAVPLLAGPARRNGVIYTMAYGDQPALINELIDWCRIVGFEVVATGKGTEYLPEYNFSTPDTVRDYLSSWHTAVTHRATTANLALSPNRQFGRRRSSSTTTPTGTQYANRGHRSAPGEMVMDPHDITSSSTRKSCVHVGLIRLPPQEWR
ncbi:hypothetical protein [Mycolicibacterium goodii]|uniref:hypothetical protein n=1 Tax=Mycolicibacterium goodii TaxID=134601 RepID=UPI000C257B54|nr:hypothetical protein [Mycolicibacterium goodii]PJK20411.1 hypothetical protein CSX11_20940 [Mycolicibacterium goodii]